jgi:hypothetical protein
MVLSMLNDQAAQFGVSSHSLPDATRTHWGKKEKEKRLQREYKCELGIHNTNREYLCELRNEIGLYIQREYV